MADPVVELESGFARGVIEKHDDGFNFYAFKGIPYGEPPIGDLRFQDPVPKKKWSGILECTDYGSVGLQYDVFNDEEYLDEDCLNVNVFTHCINKLDVKRPVMVYLHGGDFMFGAANDNYCGPNHLIRKNIVLVTLNFRLGVAGFLDLEDKCASGNQGLKDIILALQWVQLNIQVFGGDSNNVTVFGVSAGGISAHYIALSPLGKGLIHKVISQSNTVYTSFAETKNPKSNATKLCSLLGKDLVDSKDILEFLKNQDAKTLLEAEKNLRNTLATTPFGPSIDNKSCNPFMPISPIVAAAEGVHLPYLTGYNSEGGLLVLLENLSFVKLPREEVFKLMDSNFESIFVYGGKNILDRYNLSATQFRRLYYKGETVSTENLERFVELATDLFIIENVHKFARTQSEKSSAPTYLYRFSYDSPNSLGKTFLKNAPPGACHLDELPYLFSMNLYLNAGHEKFKKGTRCYRLMEQLTEMWTNFATYGKPTVGTSEILPVEWKPIADGTLLRYLNIDEDVTMQYGINVDQKLLSARDIKV